MPNGLTFLALIAAGRDAALRDTLEDIGRDVSGRRLGRRLTRPHIHFPRCRLLHFARFAVLDDPDRGPGRARLLFSSNYDGTLSEHLAELVAVTTDMDAIWGQCEGYPGVARFDGFVRAHAQEPAAFYVAFPGATAHGIRRSLDVRRRLEEHLDRQGLALLDDPDRATAPEMWPGLHEELVASAGRLPVPFAAFSRVVALVGDGVRHLLRHGPAALLRGLKQVTASLDRLPLARLFNRLTRNSRRRPRSPWSSVAVEAAAPRFVEEDAVTQNQLTLVTTIAHRDPRHVEAVMAAIDAYSRHLAPPGSLAGISTIHFVRWLVIDEGRRLMMLSDYDGSWEAYIDEFAEMILSGLDAIWGTALGYPPDGAQDLEAFKRFLRGHQVPAAAYYSGYPESTVLNLRRDLPLERAVAEGLREGRTGQWREHL